MLGYIQIHKYEMTDTSAHYKQMEYFMRAEILMPGVENRQFEGIDHAAYGIDDAAGKKP